MNKIILAKITGTDTDTNSDTDTEYEFDTEESFVNRFPETDDLIKLNESYEYVNNTFIEEFDKIINSITTKDSFPEMTYYFPRVTNRNPHLLNQVIVTKCKYDSPYYNPEFYNNVILAIIKIFTPNKDNQVISEAICYTREAKNTVIYRHLHNVLNFYQIYLLDSFSSVNQKYLDEYPDVPISPFIDVVYDFENNKFTTSNDSIISGYDFTLFYKYILVHFSSKIKIYHNTSHHTYACSNEIIEILGNYNDKHVLLQFLDVFKIIPEIVIESKHLFCFSDMIIKDTLGIYHELLLLLKTPIETSNNILQSRHDAVDIDKIKDKLSITTSKLILDILQTLIILNESSTNKCFLVSYIYKTVLNYVPLNHIFELCNKDKTLYNLYQTIGYLLFNSEKTYTSISTIIDTNTIDALKIIFITCYLDQVFKKNNNNCNETMLLINDDKNSSFFFGKTCLPQFSINIQSIPTDNIIHDIFKPMIINETCINLITIANYYFTTHNTLMLCIINNNSVAINYILNSFTELTEEHLIKYIESLKYSHIKSDENVIHRFINYKLPTTNAMIKIILDKLPVNTIFNTKSRTPKNKLFANEPDVLLILLDALNEPIDTKMIINKLPNIIENFAVTPSIITKFGVTLDDAYYACYLTNKVDFYKDMFLSSGLLKYKMRYDAKTATLIQFTKFMTTEGLKPDNYCYEYYKEHNPRLGSYFLKYSPTVKSIQYTKGIKSSLIINQIKKSAKLVQTKDYMEAECSLDDEYEEEENE